MSRFRDFHALAIEEFSSGRYWKNDGVSTDSSYNEPNQTGATNTMQWNRTFNGSFFSYADSYGILLGQAVQPSSIRQGGNIAGGILSPILDITQKSFTIMVVGMCNSLDKQRCLFTWGDGSNTSTAGRLLNVNVETDGRVALACDFGRSEEIISSAGVIKRGVRFLLVVTYDSNDGTTKLYVNGDVVASGTTQGLRGTNTGVAVVVGQKALKRTDTTAGIATQSTNGTMTATQTNLRIASVPTGLPSSGMVVINQEEMSYTYDGSGTVAGIVLTRGDSFSVPATIASSTAVGFRTSNWGPGFCSGFGVMASVMDAETVTSLTEEAGFGVPLPYPGRILSPRSWATRPLPIDTPIASDSQAQVNELVRQTNLSNGTWVNTTGYTPTIYTATMDDPVAYVRNNHNPVDSRMGGHWTAVHMPVGAVPAVGTDSEMVIWNTDSDEYHEFWTMHWTTPHTEGVNGIGYAGWGGYHPELSRFQGHYDGSRKGWGTTACGISLLSGLITIDEVINKHITHQIAIAVPGPRGGSGNIKWPAQRSDGTTANGVYEGAIFRLPYDYPWWDLPYSFTRIIARAACEYGIHVRDYSTTVVFYAERPTPEKLVELGGFEPWTNASGLRLISGDVTSGFASAVTTAAFPWNHLQRVDEVWAQNQFDSSGPFTNALQPTGPLASRRIVLVGAPTPLFAQSRKATARMLHNDGEQKIRYGPDADQLFVTKDQCPWVNPGEFAVLNGWAGDLFACTDDGEPGLCTFSEMVGV